jgi:hypothetical protein
MNVLKKKLNIDFGQWKIKATDGQAVETWETVVKIAPVGCNMELYLPNDCIIPLGYEIRGGAKVVGDYHTNDVAHQNCIEICNEVKECRAFTWYKTTQRCYLKTEIPYFCTGVEDAISGSVDKVEQLM